MDHPIRIAYFDLGFSKEEYGLHPTKYGGGGVAARYLKEEKDIEFHILAPRAAFSNVGPGEQTSRLYVLEDGACQALRQYAPVDRVIQGLNQFDILLHPHTCESLNRGQLSIPVVQFCGFDGSAGHPANDYVLLYDDSFVPQFGEKPKYVRIGKPVPSSFHDHPKAPYVFQCSRHDETMNSLETARQCRRFGIKGYFAGPIREGYPLMTEIDGKTTHYLGEIDEPTKLGYYRHATLFALPHQWPKMPFNQSVIEAQGQGCPIWATHSGPFLSKYLKPGVNGFNASQVGLLEALSSAAKIAGRDCWAAAREYDVSVMVESFKKAFAEIVSEWAARPGGRN